MKSTILTVFLIIGLGCFYTGLNIFADEDTSPKIESAPKLDKLKLEAVFADKQKFLNALEEEELTLEYHDHEENTLLHLSIVYGNRDIFAYLIESGLNINEQNKWGTTPLHLAVHYRENSMAKELIGLGADAEIEDDKAQTLLILAYKKKNWDMFAALIEAGANVQNGYYSEHRVYNSSQKTHFFYTIVHNEKAWQVYKENGAFNFQFTQYQDIYDPDLNDEPTPLHLLLDWREADKVTQVLNEQPELVNIVNGHGVPLIHMAAEQGNEDLVI